MAESVTKGMKSLELNIQDAHIRETRIFSEISVEGYDTWLQKYATRLTLTKCFASCGKILAISLFNSGRALVIMRGESCVDKAMKLSGEEGGMNLEVDPNTMKPPNSGKRKWVNYRPIGYSPPEYVLALKKRNEKEKEEEKEMKKKMEKKMEKTIKKALY